MKKAKQDWSSHVQAIKTQGISTSAYASQHGLTRSTLYRWLHKLKSAPPVHTKAEPLAATKQASKFVALRINEPERVTQQAPTHCTLVLAGGIRLEMPTLPEPQWLVDLGRCAQGAH